MLKKIKIWLMASTLFLLLVNLVWIILKEIWNTPLDSLFFFVVGMIVTYRASFTKETDNDNKNEETKADSVTYKASFTKIIKRDITDKINEG